MKREVKFRGKRIDTGEWVHGHYVVTPITDENSGTSPEAGWFFLTGEERHCIVQKHVAFLVVPETVGEFTGLHDKNGKGIYEDDIVANEAIKQISGGWIVEFDRGCFGCRGMALRAVQGIEIIGNIHDNHEYAPTP